MSAGDTAPVEGVAFTSVTSVCVEVKDGGRCEREGDVREGRCEEEGDVREREM